MRPLALNQSLLLLTGIAVALETGLLAFAVLRLEPLWCAPALLLCYHAGYLLAHVRARLGSFVDSRAAVALLLFCTGVAFLASNLPALAVSAALTSASLQLSRRRLKPHVEVKLVQKQAVKAVGMLAGFAAVAPPPALGVTWMALGAVVALFCARPALMPPRCPPAPALNPSRLLSSSTTTALLWTELLHHVHYFVYVYAMWGGLSESVRLGLPAFFLLGWIGYWMFEKKLAVTGAIDNLRLMAAGHLVGVVVLGVAAAAYPSTVVVMICWFLTGVTGGTAYQLKHADPRRELFEDLGHVLGCAMAALFMAAGGSPAGTLVLGAVFSGFTGLLAWRVRLNRRYS